MQLSFFEHMATILQRLSRTKTGSVENDTLKNATFWASKEIRKPISCAISLSRRSDSQQQASWPPFRDGNYVSCTVLFRTGRLTVWSLPALESPVGNSQPERMYCLAHFALSAFFFFTQGAWKRLSPCFELTHALFVFDMENVTSASGKVLILCSRFFGGVFLHFAHCNWKFQNNQESLGDFFFQRFLLLLLLLLTELSLSLSPCFVSSLRGKLCSWPLRGPQHLPVWTRLGRVELF